MTAYELRISDWSSDVSSSDLRRKIADALRTIARPLAAVILAVPGAGRAQLAAREFGADRAVEREAFVHPSRYVTAAGRAAQAAVGVGGTEVVVDAAEVLSAAEIEVGGEAVVGLGGVEAGLRDDVDFERIDRKSTRLNSSHSCAYLMP